MNTIHFIKSKDIKLNNKKYKGYNIGELPSRFAFIYDDNEDQNGITEWFKYKGLTYVPCQNIEMLNLSTKSGVLGTTNQPADTRVATKNY